TTRHRGASNAAQRSPRSGRPAHARAAAPSGARRGPAASVGGMTGPNLATRVGAAIARRRPAAPPDGPAAAPAHQALPAGPAPGPPPRPRLAPPPRRPPPPGAAPRPRTPGRSKEAAQAPPTPAPPPVAPSAPPAGPGRSRPAWVLAVLRRHWLFAVLLAAGLVLRVLVTVAYRPALIYVDTLKYLYGASPGSEPLGYRLILKVILAVGDLGTVAAIQHLLGLAIGVTLYVVLQRRGLSRWVAALTTAPVLLDAYELQMEQLIMPGVAFEALIVAGLAVLLWRPVVTVPFAAMAGVILAASATVMQLGQVLVVPAVIFLLAAGRGWRRSMTTSAALAAAFLGVILAYCGFSYVHDGHFWVAHRQSLAGRMAVSADCATLKLSAPARAICPTPAQQAPGPDWLELAGQSPLSKNAIQAGFKPGPAISDLNSAVLRQQPFRVAASIIRDSVRLFALTREPVLSVTPIGRWQFQTGYPTYPPWVNVCPAGSFSPENCMVEQKAVQRQVAPITGLLVRPDGEIVVGVQHKAFGRFHASLLKPAYGGPAQGDRPL